MSTKTLRAQSRIGPSCARRGIASLPPVLDSNPYQRLLYAEVERAGRRLEHVQRFSIPWLWHSRRRVGWLHFHWPQVYYEDRRLGGAAGWLRLGLFAGRLVTARALGYRLVWTIHQVYPHESTSQRLDRAAGRVLARASDVLIAHDAATASEAEKALGARGVQVLPHPAYLDVYPSGRSRGQVRESMGIPHDAFVYLAFGHIRAYKEVSVLLVAFARLPAGARLIVAGKPIDRATADQVRAAAAVDPRIVPLLEFVPDSSVAELFGAADCAVVARSDGGTSGAIILALSLGLPVVAAVAYADVVGDAGWLAATPDADGLTMALAHAAADPEVADRAAAASRRAASWTWESIGGRIADILEEACADGR